MVKTDNLELWGYFELYFVIKKVCNLDANLGGYFESSFIMTNVFVGRVFFFGRDDVGCYILGVGHSS
jgi:hypothetical protein